jgi:hypothetical protein
MGAWLLQANPDQFDVTTYVERFRDIYWSVKKEIWQRKAAVGDVVFIWRARGHSKNVSGVIASGYITEPATDKSNVRFKGNIGADLWMPGHQELSSKKIGIHLEEVRTSQGNGMLLSAHFQNDSILARSQIITVRSGAVFQLTEIQARRIRELWGSEPSSDDISSPTGLEGQIIQRLHRFRERDKTIIAAAKAEFQKRHGSLFCSICGFSFHKFYGDFGKEFIEAHHLKPISERTKAEETRVQDLVMVCANCHRMIHRDKNYESNFADLKEQFLGKSHPSAQYGNNPA